MSESSRGHQGTRALATAIACSAATGAGAAVIDVERELTAPIASSQLVVLVNPELHRPETALLADDSPPGGDERIEQEFSDIPDEFFAIGVSSDQSVFVTFDDPTIALGRSFESVFDGFSRELVYDLLLAGGQGLGDFLDHASQMEGVGASFGASATAVRFGAGDAIGSFRATIVPAPGAVGLALVCGAPVVRRRRRAASDA